MGCLFWNFGKTYLEKTRGRCTKKYFICILAIPNLPVVYIGGCWGSVRQWKPPVSPLSVWTPDEHGTKRSHAARPWNGTWRTRPGVEDTGQRACRPSKGYHAGACHGNGGWKPRSRVDWHTSRRSEKKNSAMVTDSVMMLWHGNSVRTTSPLWRESAGRRFFPSSDVELWCLICC